MINIGIHWLITFFKLENLPEYWALMRRGPSHYCPTSKLNRRVLGDKDVLEIHLYLHIDCRRKYIGLFHGSVYLYEQSSNQVSLTEKEENVSKSMQIHSWEDFKLC